MKNVIRISSYPTSRFKAMGKNSYMISGMRSVKTTFVTPKYPGELFPEPQNTSVVAFPFLLTPSPQGLAAVPHEINRIVKIIVFSIRTILLFYKHRPDIVHVHSPMFFLIGLVAKLLGKRCYITYHGNEYERVYKNRFIGKIFNFVFFMLQCPNTFIAI